MLRLIIAVSTIAFLALAVFVVRDTYSPVSAGIIIPPPGEDIFDVNGKVDIDLTLCCETTEAVDLTGTMRVVRGPMSKEGIIDIEIVALSLSGMSSLLEPNNTLVTVSLNPNAGEPAVGQIIPAKSVAFFSVPFMDVQIGPFGHFLTQPLDMFAEITGIPPFGDKFTSEFKEGGHDIQDNLVKGIDGVRGTLDRLNIDIKPPDKTYTITVLKQHADTKAGLPGWEMNLYAGSGCNGTPRDSEATDADGIAEFTGLAAGSYSVEEKLQAGWNNITPLCQNTSVPGTGGSSVAGLQACPIQPDEPFPEPGCDEFNSAASVNVEFTNPPGARIHCALSGPTQITRSAVSGTPDNIQTEITVLDLSGTCDPGGIEVTVRQSPDTPSTGKITEQTNDEPGVLEFKANSFFDIYFEVDVGGTILHNQEALHLQCKIQDIPPFGCFYEPDVGTVTLFNDDKIEVATLIHAAHIPLDPKQKLLIFINAPKPPTPGAATPTPTATPGDATPTPTATPGDDTPTPTPTLADETPTPTVTPTKTRQPQQTRFVTLRCVRTSSAQKVTGSATVTEKKTDQPDRIVLEVSCNSNTNPVVRTSYSISMSATKNIQLDVTVDSRNNACSFPGIPATQATSVNCTASPEGLELTESDTPEEPDDGDANKNGTTDSIDAALILQFVAGLTDQWPNSDTNENGIVNAIDAALVLQFSAGLVPSLPV